MSRTNFDRIKDMSIDELAEFISSISTNECSNTICIANKEIFSDIEDIKEWKY